jgi:hypothetical protein
VVAQVTAEVMAQAWLVPNKPVDAASEQPASTPAGDRRGIGLGFPPSVPQRLMDVFGPADWPATIDSHPLA